MFLAVQQDEDQPRRELIRNKTGHSEKRHRTMHDAYMRRVCDDELFRRYCGLMGCDPTLPPGQQSTSGRVAPWNWRSFGDAPPPR
eukprot:11224561-Alexandrium_andersonii.AAC.1